MKKLLLLLIGIGSAFQMNAQNLLSEMTLPDTLRSTNDSVYIDSPKWDREMRLAFTKGDTIDWGTYGYKGVYFEVWSDLDTFVIPHVNHPYEQLIKIPYTSQSDTSILILRFQETINSNFSEGHITQNKGAVNFEIPEVYELANIVLFLSECSVKTGNHPNTEYSKRVEQYFLPYKSHPLIKVLNNNCQSNPLSTYYSFRENSICFKYEEDYLQYNTPYKHVFGNQPPVMGGQFRNILYLIHDFVEKTNFRKFYSDNNSYYSQLIERQSQLLPVQEMWNWLEGEFPYRMDSYRIVFSPLIDGSHSTQKFIKGFFVEPEFQECLMFINSSEQIDSQLEYAEVLKEGLMSGIVFTEIDHNYVNPTSGENIKAVKELMSNKDFWATREAQQTYSNEYAIFNEYMTHSLFCLYVQEKYESDVRENIIGSRIELMERRGYPNFEQFNSRLLKVMKDNAKTVYEAYPELIEEMRKIE